MPTEGIETFLQQGKWEEAEFASRAALQICPANAKLHAYLGVCLFRQNKFDSAAESFSRATILDPKFSDAGAKLAQCYDRLHRYEEAYVVASEWIHVDPNNRILQALVRALELQVKGNRTDGWQRTAHLEVEVRLAQDG